MMPADILVAFEAWLTARVDTLAIPLRIVERDPDKITLQLDGITDAIEIVVVRHRITVEVKHGGALWGKLVWFECVPKINSAGVHCRLCDPEDRTVYPSRAALFADHLFEPFAMWIERVLLPARAIGLTAKDGGGRWAQLIFADHPADHRVIIPLRRWCSDIEGVAMSGVTGDRASRRMIVVNRERPGTAYI